MIGGNGNGRGAAGIAGTSASSETNTADLLLAGVTKRYRRTAAPAVDAVDLEVREGEVLALVGESGCGKSTLLRLVAGLEVPDTGEVRVGGRVVASERAWVAPERRGVGLVFQDFALFPHLRALDNVAYGLSGLSRSARRARAGELLDMVGLGEFGDRYPHQLSGGQQQRVALARALAPSPRVLLLDEPFSNLDSALKGTLRDELREVLLRTGITALLVVHDADDVLALADRAGVMRDGRITQIGPPELLYRRPDDEYVARFFGELNVLSGVPRGEGFETALGFIPCATVPRGEGPVRLCIRPEDLQVAGAGPAGGAGVVRQVRPRGLHRRILVTLENGSAAGASLTLYVNAEPPLEEGDRVFVQPRPGCAHVLRGGGCDLTARRSVG